MHFLLSIHWGFVASGFVVGSLVGLTGVGGGSLMTPILILLFGVQPVAAVGTDLLYAAATKTAGSLMHGVNRTIDWKIVGRLALGSVPAAAVTLLMLRLLGVESSRANALVSDVLAAALFTTAGALFFRKRLLAFYDRRVGTLPPSRTRAYTIATGVVLGVLVSSTSVGAGALGVTALILLYPELPVARLVGSDIAHAVPLTLVAGTGHWLLGNIDPAMLGMLLMGSVPGIILGSALAPRIPEIALQRLLAVVLVLAAVKLVY